MKTLNKVLCTIFVLAVALLAAVPAGAAGYPVDVGGLPLVQTLTGDADASLTADDNVSWDTPTNFLPDHVYCINEIDGVPDRYDWYLGMAAATAMKTAGSDGAVTYVSTDGSGCGITVVAGTITITYLCLQASEGYFCEATRYSR